MSLTRAFDQLVGGECSHPWAILGPQGVKTLPMHPPPPPPPQLSKGKNQSLTSSNTACSLTNCTCSALSIPLLMFNTWGGSSGWARISVIRPRSVLNTRSWASSSSAKAVDPRDTWYFKGPGFLLCASQSSTVSSWKERMKYQQAFLELRFSLKIYHVVLNDEKNLLNNQDFFHLLTKYIERLDIKLHPWRLKFFCA